MYTHPIHEYIGVPLTSQKLTPGAMAVGIAGTVQRYQRHTLPFTDGGSVELLPGDTVVGISSGATGDVIDVQLTSGSFAGGDAEGSLTIASHTGTFVQGESIVVGAGADDATATTVADVATEVTAPHCYKGANAKIMLIQATVASALLAFDGSNPDATYGKGFLLTPGSSYTVTDPEAIRRFRCVAAVAGQLPVVNVLCWF